MLPAVSVGLQINFSSSSISTKTFSLSLAKCAVILLMMTLSHGVQAHTASNSGSNCAWSHFPCCLQRRVWPRGPLYGPCGPPSGCKCLFTSPHVSRSALHLPLQRLDLLLCLEVRRAGRTCNPSHFLRKTCMLISASSGPSKRCSNSLLSASILSFVSRHVFHVGDVHRLRLTFRSHTCFAVSGDTQSESEKTHLTDHNSHSHQNWRNPPQAPSEGSKSAHTQEDSEESPKLSSLGIGTEGLESLARHIIQTDSLNLNPFPVSLYLSFPVCSSLFLGFLV